jgi:hypothetical protein
VIGSLMQREIALQTSKPERRCSLGTLRAIAQMYIMPLDVAALEQQ